jgi:hypothetical protein
MVARVARFEGIDVAQAQRTMGEAEAVIRPLVEALQGYKGRLDLVTAEGEFLSVTFFDTDANASAAEPTFDEEMPKRLGDLFESWGGKRLSVGVFQVVSDERA